MIDTAASQTASKGSLSGRSLAGFGDVYRDGIERVLCRGATVEAVRDTLSVASNFGTASRRTRELLSHVLSVSDTTSSLIWSEERPINIPFCFGLVAWTLSGSNDLEEIAYYNPRGRDFSDDGKSLWGAFGHRIFDGVPSQIGTAVELLRSDNASRRAVAVALSRTDSAIQTRDFPCLLAIQFVIRDGALHALTFMRSQSALMVLPYDAFLFMAIQGFVSASLGLPAGTFTHISGSFHIYEDELALARRVVASRIVDVGVSPFPLDTQSALPEVLTREARVRQAVIARDARCVAQVADEVGDRCCSTFLDEMLCVLLVEAARRLGMTTVAVKQLDRLAPSLRRAMEFYLETTYGS